MLFKHSTIFILFLCLADFCNAQQNEIPVRYYLSTPDFVENKLSDEEIIAVVKDSGANFIQAKMLLNAQSKERSKTGEAAWAILHNDEVYINMRWAYMIPNNNFFIKPEIFGHYILIVLDEATLKSFNKSRGNPYGYGLMGAAINQSAIDGGNFEDINGNKMKIIFINRDYSTVNYKKNMYSQAMLLDRSTMIELLAKNNVERKPKDFTYEKIISLINELNQRYK